MKKAYFQYYETFENILEKIKDIEEREHMRKTIINYGLYGTLPAGLSELEEMAWTICKDLIDQQQHRRQINSENAKRKKSKNEAEAPQICEGEIENIRLESQNGMSVQTIARIHGKSVKEVRECTARFKKPSLEEVEEEIKEKEYNVSAPAFINYYESNGWKVGRNPMKSWKATLASWNARERKESGNIYQQADDVREDYAEFF